MKYHQICWAMLALFIADPASSCSFSLKKQTPTEIQKAAITAVEAASVIIDAEVITPMSFDERPGQIPAATLKVMRVLKGHPDDIVLIAYVSSCDIALEQERQQFRILLSGQDIFTAFQGSNGAPYSGSDRAIFNRAVDAALGHSRPQSFVGFPGELPVQSVMPNP